MACQTKGIIGFCLSKITFYCTLLRYLPCNGVFLNVLLNCWSTPPAPVSSREGVFRNHRSKRFVCFFCRCWVSVCYWSQCRWESPKMCEFTFSSWGKLSLCFQPVAQPGFGHPAAPLAAPVQLYPNDNLLVQEQMGPGLPLSIDSTPIR